MSSVYERRPDEYEKHAEVSAYNALYDRPAMLDVIGDVAGLDVLDAGCGPGFYSAQLVSRGATVVGVDQSAGMIDLARRRVGDRATFRVQDLGTPLGWAPEGSFDVVIMALVIHHIDDRLSALKEMFRVLRPGGHLVMSTHHPMTDWVRLGGSYFDVEVVEEVWSNDWDVRYWRQPLTETCEEVRRAGFLIEQIVEPKPSEELRKAYPDTYLKLSECPGFIMLKLIRP